MHISEISGPQTRVPQQLMMHEL